MPLSERARIEVYRPDLPKPSYQELLETLDREFTCAFGGSTIIRGLDGSYLSQLGTKMRDRVSLIYTDVAVGFDRNFTRISVYADRVKASVVERWKKKQI